ncbi:MAG: hypothetical protein Sv326_1159 [Candidatus Fermentimicrarchaeum limneticum]|uniref:Uncharacterized protein n=1 Tax=Fermentimicrarchaeum limneticum TaxID=2795018 RepID=A0A7D5XIM7_FERL1|nr:MAG: hypothetical protein Sv326_1159 [Candidatus Fermentimicrarchaeum limneticum]
MKFKRWTTKHHKFLLFVLVVSCSLWLWLSGTIEKFVLRLGDYGYLGAFVGGFFYSYGVTSPFSVVLFAALAENVNMTVAAVLGGLSAMVSDYLIFKSVEESLKKPVRINHHKIKIPKIKSKLFLILSLPLAAFIIGSPLPDELAAALLGLEGFDDKAFILISFAFNSLGLLVIMLLAKTLV